MTTSFSWIYYLLRKCHISYTAFSPRLRELPSKIAPATSPRCFSPQSAAVVLCVVLFQDAFQQAVFNQRALHFLNYLVSFFSLLQR